MAIPKPRNLTKDEIAEILAVEKTDITLDYMRGLFACKYGETAPRFNTYDKFILRKGTFYNNEDIETTIGRYFANFIFMPKAYLEKYGYANVPLNKKNLGEIESKIGNMLLNDQISTKEVSDYLDAGEWIGMGLVDFLSPTMNYDINVPIPEVIAKRDELFEKNKEGIRRGESAVADSIEREVIALAKQKIKEKGNEAYDFFESGIGKFENNYKKTSIMAGAIENPYTKKLDILKSNYIDGIDPKEFSKFTNLTIIGGYSRGVATQVSGYQTKKIRNAMQALTLDEAGSDCGTKYTLDIVIPEKLKNLFLNRYILDGSGNLVFISDQNINNFVNKKVKLRSPMFCKSDCICNKCAGELFYKMGMKNVGLLNDTMSNVLMNVSMKKFHDATIKFTTIDIEKYIIKR